MDQLEELHPVRYAQVPHEALDGLPDLNSIGMLSIMLRHRADFPFTVDRVIKQKKAIPGPKLGETVAYGAMTTLIEHRWAARVKFRCAGGHMHTSIFRTAQQFTLDDYREICGRFLAGTEKILHCKGCSDDPKIPVRTTIRAGASLQWAKDTSKNGTPIADLLAPGGALALTPALEIPGTGVTSNDAPVPGFPGTGVPVTGAPGTFKNNSGEQEGEEGDARARAGGDPSPVDEPQWGVAGGHRPAAPSGASASLIAGIARTVLLENESLTPEEHRELAALADMARPLVDQTRGLSWEEYTAWLRQGWVRPDGRRTFRTLAGALRWRLAPEQIQTKAWAWACEQRGAREASEARGGREVPESTSQVHASTCGRHGTTLTDDGRCLRCEQEARDEDRRKAAEEAAAAAADSSDQEEYDEYTDEDLAMIELDPEELAAAYRSMGTPPTEAYAAARAALEANRSK